MDYVTYLPRTVEYDDGSRAILAEEEVLRGCLRLYVPRNFVDCLYEHLKRKGFADAIPSVPKGEKYSVSKVIKHPWELHIRIYADGFIEAEVEVSREHFEHLSDRRVPVIYEAYECYRDLYSQLHIYDVNRRKWIVDVIDHYQVAVRHPDTLIPWKPIAVTAVMIAVVGLIAYALSRISRPRE